MLREGSTPLPVSSKLRSISNAKEAMKEYSYMYTSLHVALFPGSHPPSYHRRRKLGGGLGTFNRHKIYFPFMQSLSLFLSSGGRVSAQLSPRE